MFFKHFHSGSTSFLIGKKKSTSEILAVGKFWFRYYWDKNSNLCISSEMFSHVEFEFEFEFSFFSDEYTYIWNLYFVYYWCIVIFAVVVIVDEMRTGFLFYMHILYGTCMPEILYYGIPNTVMTFISSVTYKIENIRCILYTHTWTHQFSKLLRHCCRKFEFFPVLLFCIPHWIKWKYRKRLFLSKLGVRVNEILLKLYDYKCSVYSN